VLPNEILQVAFILWGQEKIGDFCLITKTTWCGFQFQNPEIDRLNREAIPRLPAPEAAMNVIDLK
jgi:hypothetical protein